METKVIKNLIASYFRIVKINMIDLVPKAIMAFLVNDIKNKAQMALVEKVYLKDNLDTLLVEDPQIVRQREECSQLIKALREA